MNQTSNSLFDDTATLPERPANQISREEPHWTGARGQIANLWLYVYCLMLFWLILPIFCALYRVLATHYHRYELMRERLRITTGLYRPHIQMHEIRFDRIKDVRVTGPRHYRIVGRRNVVLERVNSLSPVYLEGIHYPERVRDTIVEAIDAYRARNKRSD